MATTDTSNSALVRSLIDAINDHDTTAMRSGWTADTVERFPETTCRGADELAAYFQALFDSFPDVRLTIVGMAEEGESVFMRWHLTGTHTGGTFQGIAPTGKHVELDGMDQFTVRDGKIVENFAVYDQMQFGRALGLLPPDGSGPDKALKAAFNAATAVRKRIAQR